MDLSRLKGLGVALATPFKPASSANIGAARFGAAEFGAGAVDLPAFRALVKRVIAGGPGGADFLVALGSTGEAATIADEERDLILKAALEEAQGVPVFLGTGHNSTAKAVELAARAAALGADGILVVTPYETSRSRRASRRISAPSRRPCPACRSSSTTCPDARLEPPAQGPRAALADPRRSRGQGVLGEPRANRRDPPSDARGQAPVLRRRQPRHAHYRDGRRRNHLGDRKHPPRRDQALVDASLAGRRDEARKLHARLLPLIDALFLESNPAPLKAALGLAGWCADAVRLPLAPASEATRARLAQLLPDYGIAAKPTAG